MCLERAFSGYLAYFFEVGLRGDTKGPKRGKEGEGLSPVDIGDRASDSGPGSPMGQPWVPATSFLFCVRWATRPNCQPLTLSHLESDGGPTASMPSAARPHCILPARNLETLTIF